MASNLPLLFAELLAAGVLIVKGSKMFAGALGNDAAGADETPEDLGQGGGSAAPAAGPLPGVKGVRAVWAAATELGDAHPAYVWGGGHGSSALSGADCSGAISYVLNRAGLLTGTLTSGQFMGYGDAGPGRYVTIYANEGHVIMSITIGSTVHWFGTSGFGHPDAPNKTGANWFTVKPTDAYLTNFTARHPPGL